MYIYCTVFALYSDQEVGYRYGGKREEAEGELRRLRALSQEELAEASGVGRATISRIERGETGAHGRTLRRLATALGVAVEELVKVEANDA
jgi:transcriptional regulator with XRE-family HTH domain